MNAELFHPLNPIYMPDLPKEVIEDTCQCCDDAPAIETWQTVQGRKKICSYCLAFHKEEGNYLIEKVA